MRLRSARTALPAALLTLVAIPPLHAQTVIHTHAAEITLTGRLHTQWNTTSAQTEPRSEFIVRRARFDAFVKINDFVSGLVQPEYAEGKVQLRVAYMRLAFNRAINAMIGQYKRAFDLFTLTSSNDILVVERTGRLRGVDPCSGPGGLCSYGQFMEQLQYSAVDIGLFLDGQDASGRVGYGISFTNGAGPNQADENSAKSASARAVVEVAPHVRIAGNLALHDYVKPSSEDGYAAALGGDLEIGTFGEGFHLQAGAVSGSNWKDPIAGGPPTFFTAQAIATYKIPIHRMPYAEAIEPLARLSWGDPNTGNPGDGGILLTPGLVWYITGRNKMAANVDVWHPQAGPDQWGVKLQSYLYF